MSEENKAHVYHIVALMFESADGAYELVQQAKKDGLLKDVKTVFSVIVRRTSEGKVKLANVKGMNTWKGAGWGAAAGLVLGLIGSGGLLAPVAAASGIGALVAKQHDKKELKEAMNKLIEAMPNGSSMLMAVLQDKEAEKMIDEVEGVNAQVVTFTLGDESAGVMAHMVDGEIDVDADVLLGEGETENANEQE